MRLRRAILTARVEATRAGAGLCSAEDVLLGLLAAWLLSKAFGIEAPADDADQGDEPAAVRRPVFARVALLLAGVAARFVRAALAIGRPVGGRTSRRESRLTGGPVRGPDRAESDHAIGRALARFVCCPAGGPAVR